MIDLVGNEFLAIDTRKFIIGITEAIKTGIIKLLLFLAITTKILPKKNLIQMQLNKTKCFALFQALRYLQIVVAVLVVTPLNPSISLAMNNKNKGIAAK